MPIVPTPRLALTKPEIDGSDDDWGGLTNTDWDIVDRVYRDLTGGLVSAAAADSNYHAVNLIHNGYADKDSINGFRLLIRSGRNVTGPMTLDVGDGMGGTAVKKFVDGDVKALEDGDFPLGYMGDFAYRRAPGDPVWILMNPASGLVSSVPNASTTVRGIVELATAAEVETGTDAVRAITPAVLPIASTTKRGLVRLATSAEVASGTNATEVVTPATLRTEINKQAPAATMTVAGIVEIATADEVQTGTDNTRAVSPLGLPDSSTAKRGLIPLATNVEVLAGTVNNKAVTPITLHNALIDYAPAANSSRAGIIEMATNEEALEGAVTNRAITPANLEYVDINRGARTANQLCTHGNLVVTRTGVDTVHIVASSVMLFRGDAAIRRFTNIVENANVSNTGPGGRDGTLDNNAWYSIWIIGKEDGTMAALLSLADGGGGPEGGAASGPTMPSGYVYRGYVGSVRNDGGSFVNFHQNGHVACINGPVIAVSVADNEWVKAGISVYVPPEALSITVTARVTGDAADTLAVRLAPLAVVGGTGFGTIGETLLQGLGTRSSQATIMLAEPMTLYTRVNNSAAGDPVTDLDIFVNGYTL